MSIFRPFTRVTTSPLCGIFTAVRLLPLLLALTLAACGGQSGSAGSSVATVQPTSAGSGPGTAAERPARPVPTRLLGTVAVTKVAIDHPSAKLVFQPNGVSDTIVRQLQAGGGYRVIDWTSLQDVLFRRNLEWSDLQENKDLGREIREVLFNDYFLMGSITAYGERMEFSASAFSKAKTQIVSTTVELAIKDALTNEIVASARGVGEESRQVTQTLGFGAAGGIDTVMANRVLEKAIDQALGQLTERLAALPPPDRPVVAAAKKGDPATPAVTLANRPKVLFILAEEEEQDNEPGVINEKAMDPALELSITEQAMAEEFDRAKAQVLTASDVVNRAYSISGGEELLLSGWASEEEFRQLEDLLQARSGLGSYAVEVGKTVQADIVVTGSVGFHVIPGQGPGGVQTKQSSVFVNVKAIAVGSGETLAITSARQSYMAILFPSAFDARTQSLNLAGRKAARELLSRVAEKPELWARP